MNDLLRNLNEEQLAAVMHKEGPLLIVAGAGTGKTTAITQRIAYLLEQGKAGADEILALTFTEKAAGEMEERVDRLLPFGYLDLWISTFHGFGERIIKDHGLEIGLPSDAKLLNEFEQWALIKKNLEKFDLDYYRPLGNPTKFIHALVRHFSRAKDENISPAEYLKYAEELKENLDTMLSGSKRKKGGNFQFSISNFQKEGGKPDKDLLTQEIGRINEVANAYHVYQQLLLDNNAMDFGDLINYCLKLFRERPSVLARYRRQFKYILVDEFQDTNWAQYELVKMLSAPENNLVVVGDDDQSIYAFRGASMSNILHFKEDYPEAREIVLTRNYRNRQNILDLAYNFIQLNNPNRLEWQLGNDGLRTTGKKNKLSKKLIAEVKGEGVIEVIKGEDLRDEVRRVVEKIAEIKIGDKEANWSDFAVLVRANESAKEICLTLDAAGLPYQFLASRGLYAKPVIMDTVAYLKMLDDYHESSAFYRVLNLPVFEFSYQELVNFNYAARKKTWSLYTVLKEAKGKFGTEAQAKIDRVLGLIARHTAIVREKSATEVILAFLEDSGYLKYLTGQPEAKAGEATAYLNQFMKRVRAFEAGSDEVSVKAFLSELDMEIDAGEEGALSPDAEAGPDMIKVMTVHAAKGLEFKYVFLASMVDKRFPTIERRDPIAIPDALVREILPEGEVHTEEERRLFYVAATRAKQGLYFSWAPDYGGARKKKPSRFLTEAGLITPKDGKKKRERGVGMPLLSAGSRKSKIENRKSKIELPPYFSYTQLAAFKNCPYQYKFAHILKVPVRGKCTFSFGQTMHLTLQKLFQLVNEKRGLGQRDLFGKQPNGGENSAAVTFEEILEIYEHNWIDNWYDNKKQKDEYRKLGRDILRGFYGKFKDNWPRTLYLEQGVNLKAGGSRIYGKIDRVDDLGGGKVRIVDYKTGTPKKAEKIGLEEKEQLLLYQMAAAQTLPGMEVSELQFYYLNDNSEINFLGSAKDLAGMEEKLLKRIEEIKQAVEHNEFPPKPGVLCKYCDFFHICEFRG